MLCKKGSTFFFLCVCICSILPSVLFPSPTSILSRHRYIPSTLNLPPSPAPRSLPQNLFSKPALDRTRSPRGRWMSSKPPGDQNQAPRGVPIRDGEPLLLQPHLWRKCPTLGDTFPTWFLRYLCSAWWLAPNPGSRPKGENQHLHPTQAQLEQPNALGAFHAIPPR